jgi:hypothetical protein
VIEQKDKEDLTEGNKGNGESSGRLSLMPMAAAATRYILKCLFSSFSSLAPVKILPFRV